MLLLKNRIKRVQIQTRPAEDRRAHRRYHTFDLLICVRHNWFRDAQIFVLRLCQLFDVNP